MCVAIYKPKGKELPSYTILNACALRNPHGFGFATANRIFKSMDFDEFYNELKKVRPEEHCMIHFRLATHGSRKQSNCHPFAARINGEPRLMFCHNGILNIEPIGDTTDSETALRTIIAPTVRKYGIDSKELKTAVSDILGGSKFIMIQGDKAKLFGHFEQFQGCYYSNLHWLSYRYLCRSNAYTLVG